MHTYLKIGLAAALLFFVSLTSVLAADDVPENALATVNGNPVTKTVREAVVSQLRANGQKINEKQILDELINLELLAQEAQTRGLHEKAEVAAMVRLQYTQTLAQALMGELSKDIEITDDELRAEYDKQTANMQVDEYRASHILLEDEAAAVAVINELEDGADFAELAKNKSTGPTGPTGGDLGWFQGDSMVPEFSEALATMEVGASSSEPVKSEFGWHVIKLVDKRGTNLPKFEETTGELRNLIMRERLTALIDTMRSKADVRLAAE